MIFTAIQYTIISLFVIAIFHYLLGHFTNNLTVPKVKDLVSGTNAQYETILNRLEGKQINNNNNSNNKVSSENKMKDELKEYLQTVRDTKANSSDLDNGFDNPYSSENIQFSSGQGDELAYSTY